MIRGTGVKNSRSKEGGRGNKRLQDYQIEQHRQRVVYVAWQPCIEDTLYRHQQELKPHHMFIDKRFEQY